MQWKLHSFSIVRVFFSPNSQIHFLIWCVYLNAYTICARTHFVKMAQIVSAVDEAVKTTFRSGEKKKECIYMYISYPLDLCTTKRNLIRKSRYFVAFRVKIALLMKLNLYVRHDVQAFISHKYNIKMLPFISMLGRLFLLYILFFLLYLNSKVIINVYIHLYTCIDCC